MCQGMSTFTQESPCDIIDYLGLPYQGDAKWNQGDTMWVKVEETIGKKSATCMNCLSQV